uniref:Zn(2)-C6 fungal-type domain-containing protein n=1 Tax=Bionectria ochroleuca TaxID=29856 RepID=A0A8H7MZL7_BIOOC
MRRGHTKSRFGCKQCKKRKVKCDEAKPSCLKCVSRRQHCSYLQTTLPAPISPASTSTPSLSSSTTVSSPSQFQDQPVRTRPLSSVPADDASSSSFGASFFEAKYTLLHLEILDHLRSHKLGFDQLHNPALDRLLELAFSEAYQTPYLMDEMLAFAAAHKSTLLTGDLQHLYRTESIRLQTRAVSQVDFDRPSDSASLAPFLFSMFLGQHVLFDVFSSTLDFAKSLDKLIQCFNLHHGIRSTASKSWEAVQHLMYSDPSVDYTVSRTLVPLTTEGSHCDGLVNHLEHSGLDQHVLATYRQTVKVLQYLFDSVYSSDTHRMTALQQWPVRISTEYIQLLQQRRPEALVVLAYYGVLLHYAREYWAVGHSGRVLVSSISSHLGDYWADWLAWPQQEVEQT